MVFVYWFVLHGPLCGGCFIRHMGASPQEESGEWRMDGDLWSLHNYEKK